MFREEAEEIISCLHQDGIIVWGGIGLFQRTFADDGRLRRDPELLGRKPNIVIFTSPNQPELTSPLEDIPKVYTSPNLNFNKTLKTAVRKDQENVCLVCFSTVPDGSKLQVHHGVMKRYYREFIKDKTDPEASKNWQDFIKSSKNAVGTCPSCHKTLDAKGIKEHVVYGVDEKDFPENAHIPISVVYDYDLIRRN